MPVSEDGGAKMIHKKGFIAFLVISIASVLLLLFDLFLYDALIYFNSPGAKVAMGLFIYFVLFIYAITAIIVLIHIAVNIKIIKLFAIAHCTTITLTVLFFTYLPFTETYHQLYFAIEKNHLNETIQLYEEGALSQIGIDKYIVPYRLTSHTGKVYFFQDEQSINALFTIYKGFHKSSNILYSSGCDAPTVDNNYFGLCRCDTLNINKIDEHWYTITTTY